jgi:hypothetical protein
MNLEELKRMRVELNNTLKDSYVVLDDEKNIKKYDNEDQTNEMVKNFEGALETLTIKSSNYIDAVGISLFVSFSNVGKYYIRQKEEEINSEFDFVNFKQNEYDHMLDRKKQLYRDAYEKGDILKDYVYCNIFSGDVCRNSSEKENYEEEFEVSGIVNLNEFLSQLNKLGYSLNVFSPNGVVPVSYDTIFESKFSGDDGNLSRCDISFENDMDIEKNNPKI